MALLEKVTVGAEHGFVAFDYLVALLDGQHSYLRQDVLPDIWDFVIDSLSEEEAMSAGITAHLRKDLAAAEHIWRTLAGGTSDHAPAAVINLGVLLAEQGDLEGAKEAYQWAIDSGYPDYAPMAADLLERIG